MRVDLPNDLPPPDSLSLALHWDTVRVVRGIYQSNHWNFESYLPGPLTMELEYPALSTIACCGVCDSVAQLQTRLPPEVIEGPCEYIISVVPIKKAEQSANGGWRWHKWGPYIGVQTPTTEYLYDEPVIEEVWTYHIYRVS
jgi:hypothetical protein